MEKKTYTVVDIQALSKKDLTALIVAGSLTGQAPEVLAFALEKLATKSTKQEKIIVAIREYTKDHRAGRYAKGDKVELQARNVHNIVNSYSGALPNMFTKDQLIHAILNEGFVFNASWYTITPVKA